MLPLMANGSWMSLGSIHNGKTNHRNGLTALDLKGTNCVGLLSEVFAAVRAEARITAVWLLKIKLGQSATKPVNSLSGTETSSNSGISICALVDIILGSIACVISLSAIFILLLLIIRLRRHDAISKPHHSSKIAIQIDGTRAFTYEELSAATSNFDNNAQIGQRGYKKVYKGIPSNGIMVAIKHAHQGSLRGEKEFLTEIRTLSTIHHRKLVSLIGYRDKEGEQLHQKNL
ncbi:unnamed protein product [Vicia faba]|uniref:Protein kinase domain-containing protein n=1 Tax=Vicia faba TaxID=3906 RepID=A0AAV1AQX6_VICFA|nr:unnamed protein product [Vicia faba]